MVYILGKLVMLGPTLSSFRAFAIDKKRPAVLGYSLHSVMAVFYAVRKMLLDGGVEVECILKVMDIIPSSGSTAQLRRDNV
jgi:hypothetical protein